MNVHDTVRRMIWHYPSLCKTRADALHHLFYVLGNGYEWENGELVDVGRSYEVRVDTDAYWKSTPPDYSRYPLDVQARFEEQDIEFVRQYNAEVDAVRDNIDACVYDMTLSPSPLTGTPFVPYPPCPKYCPAWNLPENIRPDWQAAADEIRAVIQPYYDRSEWRRAP